MLFYQPETQDCHAVSAKQVFVWGRLSYLSVVYDEEWFVMYHICWYSYLLDCGGDEDLSVLHCVSEHSTQNWNQRISCICCYEVGDTVCERKCSEPRLKEQVRTSYSSRDNQREVWNDVRGTKSKIQKSTQLEDVGMLSAIGVWTLCRTAT